MNNYKIRVNNEAESREAQELFFELGYKHKWDGAVVKESWNKARFVYAEDKILWSGNCSDDFAECDFQELTLPQLRDLVVLHRNDIDDANWETEGDDQIYQDSSGKSFIFREQGWDELQHHEMRQAMWEKTKSKPQTPENEQGLISGADALIAIGKGERVQYSFDDDKYWQNDIANLKITDFGGGHYAFRLKPRTVKLEIEVPLPFKPNSEDEFKNAYRIQVGNKQIFWKTEADFLEATSQIQKILEHSK